MDGDAIPAVYAPPWTGSDDPAHTLALERAERWPVDWQGWLTRQIAEWSASRAGGGLWDVEQEQVGRDESDAARRAAGQRTRYAGSRRETRRAAEWALEAGVLPADLDELLALRWGARRLSDRQIAALLSARAEREGRGPISPRRARDLVARAETAAERAFLGLGW